MNVLIVDDEYLELAQLKSMIQAKYPQWHVFEAEDGPEARSIAEKQPLDLALIDIHLPGESGLELAVRLKQYMPDLSVVIVTAYQNFNYAKKAIQLSVVDYIVKPIIAEELYEVIEKCRKTSVNSESPFVEEAIHYIQKHYREKVQLPEVAEYVHVSPNYLSRKFTEETSLTFSDYLIRYRLQQAKKMMHQHPHYTMYQIAHEVGFSSQHHFTNCFRKYEKMTPTAYRGQLKHD